MAIKYPENYFLGQPNVKAFPKVQFDKIKEIIDALNDLTDGTISTTDLTLSGDLIVGDDATIGDDLAVGGDLSVAGNATIAGNLTVDDFIKSKISFILEEPGAGIDTITIVAPAVLTGGSYVLTLPADDGTASQVLTTDGSGVTSWTTPGGGLSAFAMFYGLTAGTGMAGTDYAATVAAGAPVPFPQDGPALGGIVSTTDTTFTIPAIGTYKVTFAVHTTEPGQLQLTLDGTVIPRTTVANMNPTSGGHPIVGNSIITTTLVNQVLSVINPAGNSTALTITPADGANTHANSQSLIIERIA